jgi:hypothetical protein
MKTGLQGLCLLSIAVGIGGCYIFNKYTPLVETTPTSGAQYRCEIKRLDWSSGDLCTTVYDDTNRKKKTLRLKGKAHRMTVSSTGDVLAIGILVPTDHDESPSVYVPDHDAIVFIDTEDLREINRWPIKAPGVPLPAPGRYVEPIVCFDELAFSDDGKMIVTSYRKPVDGETQAVVTLWGMASGTYIREFPLGPPNKAFFPSFDLALSPDDELLPFRAGTAHTSGQRTPPSGRTLSSSFGEYRIVLATFYVLKDIGLSRIYVLTERGPALQV